MAHGCAIEGGPPRGGIAVGGGRGAKRPWVVTVAASVFLIYFTGGYLHARGRRQVLDAYLMTAITNFDPSAGAKPQGLKNNAPEFEKVFQPVLVRAIQIAPDQSAIALSLAQQGILAPTGTDISRCVARAQRPQANERVHEARAPFQEEP